MKEKRNVLLTAWILTQNPVDLYQPCNLTAEYELLKLEFKCKIFSDNFYFHDHHFF